MDFSKYFKYFIVFTLAFNFCILLFVYIFNLPALITGNQKLVNEYYIKNIHYSVLFDTITVLIYLIIANFFIKLLNIKNIFYKSLIVLITTVLISGVVYLYIISKPMTNNFYSRWFHSVGLRGILYDIAIILVIYLLYEYTIHRIK